MGEVEFWVPWNHNEGILSEDNSSRGVQVVPSRGDAAHRHHALDGHRQQPREHHRRLEDVRPHHSLDAALPHAPRGHTRLLTFQTPPQFFDWKYLFCSLAASKLYSRHLEVRKRLSESCEQEKLSKCDVTEMLADTSYTYTQYMHRCRLHQCSVVWVYMDII